MIRYHKLLTNETIKRTPNSNETVPLNINKTTKKMQFSSPQRICIMRIFTFLAMKFLNGLIHYGLSKNKSLCLRNKLFQHCSTLILKMKYYSVAEPEPQGAASFGRSRSRYAIRLRLQLRRLRL
jgi:hypothetical protein